MANWKTPDNTTPPQPAKKPRGALLTTKEKVDNAAAQALLGHQTSTSAKMPPPPSAPPKRPTKTKTISLPPPSEMLAEMEHAKEKAAEKEPKPRKPAPLTTKEKVVAARVSKVKAQRKAAAQEKKKKSGLMLVGKVDGVGKKKARDKVNLMDFFGRVGIGREDQSPEKKVVEGGDAKVNKSVSDEAKAKEKEKARESVLMRMTERSRKWNLDAAKAAEQAAKIAAMNRDLGNMEDGLPNPGVASNGSVIAADAVQADNLTDPKPTTTDTSPPPSTNKKKKTLLDFPTVVRARIFRLAVVETSHFLYPDTPTGHEQPDLAMTCRQIRAETLPIFYGETVFGVDIYNPRPQNLCITKSSEPSEPSASIAALQKWMAVLSEQGHMQHARKWVFSYFPLPSPLTVSASRDVVISLIYPRPSDSDSADPLTSTPTSTSIPDSSDPPANFLPTITVHRSALCLTPSHSRYAPCRPGAGGKVAWLEELVRSTALTFVAQRHEQVLEIARMLERRAGEVGAAGLCVEVEGKWEDED